MKVGLIADLHFGIHKSSNIFLDSQLKYFNDEFIPYLKNNTINDVFILGDIFDNRNSINVKIINEVYHLFDELSKVSKLYILIGNHDMYLKTNNDIHSLKFLKKFENIKLIDDKEIIEINDKKILLSSWQIDENDFTKYLNNVTADYCFGHFDINGFKMNKFKNCDMGFNDKIFHRFKKVFSGHYHLRSSQTKNNTEIIYVGTPYSFTRDDINEEKGFCVLDLEKDNYEFINNKNSIKFILIKYPTEINKDLIKNNIVDVQVEYNDKYNEADFQNYLQKIETFSPISVSTKLINNFLTGDEIKNVEEYKTTDILSLIDQYIMGLDINNKEKIERIIHELYEEVKVSTVK